MKKNAQKKVNRNCLWDIFYYFLLTSLKTHHYFLHTRGRCNGLFVDLYWLYFLNIFDLFFKTLDQCVCQLVVLVTLDQIWIQMIFRYLTVHTILPPHHTTIDTQHCTSFLLIASKALSMAGWRLL